MNILSILTLLRPTQWAKNVFIFIPLFFSGNLLNTQMWYASFITFISFSLVASGVYCLNDIRDIEADRIHPKKKFRPIASGAVSITLAWIIMGILLCGGLALSLFGLSTTPWTFIIISTYLCLNIAYCLKLKQIAIVDVFIIATGFVLRVMAGGTACEIWISPWLICLTFLLALFLAFAKRRDDVVIMEDKGVIVRKNIISYNSDFLNQTLGIVAAITTMSYIMYTVSPEVEIRLGSEYLYVSAVFVLAGILRYLQVALVDLKSGSPTKILLKDRFIHYSILGWILTFLVIIYL